MCILQAKLYLSLWKLSQNRGWHYHQWAVLYLASKKEAKISWKELSRANVLVTDAWHGLGPSSHHGSLQVLWVSYGRRIKEKDTITPMSVFSATLKDNNITIPTANIYWVLPIYWVFLKTFKSMILLNIHNNPMRHISLIKKFKIYWALTNGVPMLSMRKIRNRDVRWLMAWVESQYRVESSEWFDLGYPF